MTEDAPGDLTIGGLADAAGVSVETVRYYERRGLIDQPPRPVGGYRRYPREDVERINFIRRAKQLGFTLTEVRELICSSASGEMEQILASARRKLQEARLAEEEARRRQAALSSLVAVCEDKADGCLGLVVAPRS